MSSACTTTARTRTGRTSSWSSSTARTSRRSFGATGRSRRRRRRGSQPPSPARLPRAASRPTRVSAAVARALAAAHARGIVHRDVKPGNVLIGRDGRVKVVDFGIPRAVAAGKMTLQGTTRALAEAQMTLPGTTLGSVHYFSPEQARGETATNESDIYALGIVMYEMLTGVRPWEGDSAASGAAARPSGAAP